jgi:hypothetical protein
VTRAAAGTALAALASTTLALAWRLGDGWSGLAYLFYYAIITLPGWPLGWRLFGRRHAAGWIAGALIGYGLSAVTLALLIRGGLVTPWWMAGGLFAVTIIAWQVWRRGKVSWIALPPWGARETLMLAGLLLLVPALVWWPFSHIGWQDASGDRLYHAYFTADFLWHTALTHELARFSLPPSNPYLADQTLHYYWTYFIVPAVAAGLRLLPLRVEQILALNALAAGLLFFGVFIVTIWIAVPRVGAVVASVLVGVLAPSAEGAYALLDLYRHGRALGAVRQLNIDAMSAWAFQALRIDDLPRSLWYVPQHAAACALGLIAIQVASAAGVTAPLGAALTVGVALGLSICCSPLLGGTFAVTYGLWAVMQAVAAGPRAGRYESAAGAGPRARPFAGVWRQAAAALPAAALLGWCVSNAMFDGAGGALYFGLLGPARQSPVLSLLLSLGPLLVPALIGLWFARRWPRTGPAALLAALGLFLMYFVSLAKVDAFWVGFRAGQILLVSLPILAACWFAALFASRRWRPVGWAAVVVILIVGLPTTVIDAYNAQDVANDTMGPGFHWTIAITPEEQQAFDWIQHATRPDAIVQMEPTSRARETWTLIPTFAGRRMSAGLPISLINIPAYGERSDQVRAMYATTSAAEAARLARQLHIDYVYVDRTERRAFSRDAIDKFDKDPLEFVPVYRNAEVRIYGVRPAASAAARRAMQPASLKLGIENGAFTVNGEPKFLVFASYFDAMDVAPPDLHSDFAYLKSKGVDGVRIFPNWWDVRQDVWSAPRGHTYYFAADTLMAPDGTIRSGSGGPLDRFRQVLDIARDEGLLVDVSFSAESVAACPTGDCPAGSSGLTSLDLAGYQRALVDLTRRLAADASANAHVLFDLQNEYDENGASGHAFTDAQIKALRDAVKAADPTRLVTASIASSVDAATAARRETTAGVDVIAWHGDRRPRFWTGIGAAIAAIKTVNPNLPVYLQEPERLRPQNQSWLTADGLGTDVHNARVGGAAAWCFHTGGSFRMDGSNLQAKLRPEEKAFLNCLRSYVQSGTCH